MPGRREAREAAIASTEEACPRCGTSRAPEQEYCLNCGLRLPSVTGPTASFRRGWIRRFGWYPGDWVLSAALTLLVALAGAGVAITLSGTRGHAGTTLVATTSLQPTTTTATTTTTKLPVPPEPTTTKTTPKTTTTSTTTTSKTTTTTTTTTTPTTTTPTTTTPPPTTTTTPLANGQSDWPSGQSGWTDVLGSYPVSGGRAAAAAV
ncbi:MAG: hypothetical protein JO064_11145, partial [Actinobacteria bacterium]|nr:hypothetical protein [Actinomycetota bacterium]